MVFIAKPPLVARESRVRAKDSAEILQLFMQSFFLARENKGKQEDPEDAQQLRGL
jgi:hypothetical protein